MFTCQTLIYHFLSVSSRVHSSSAGKMQRRKTQFWFLGGRSLKGQATHSDILGPTVAHSVKESACCKETWDLISGWEDPLEAWCPTPVFTCLGDPHGQRLDWHRPTEYARVNTTKHSTYPVMPQARFIRFYGHSILHDWSKYQQAAANSSSPQHQWIPVHFSNPAISFRTREFVSRSRLLAIPKSADMILL